MKIIHFNMLTSQHKKLQEKMDVGQMLTKTDGGGVQEPLILADVICEQPLIVFIQIEESCYIFSLSHRFRFLKISPLKFTGEK